MSIRSPTQQSTDESGNQLIRFCYSGRQLPTDLPFPQKFRSRLTAAEAERKRERNKKKKKKKMERVFLKVLFFSGVLWSLDGSRARTRCTKKKRNQTVPSNILRAFACVCVSVFLCVCVCTCLRVLVGERQVNQFRRFG